MEDPELQRSVKDILFRPADEMYIPIPQSKRFHSEHPDFFVPNLGRQCSLKKIKSMPREDRRFMLVFEPSGERLESYITQENGKAIESWEKQTILGDWLLRRVFQLDEHEPLTRKRLDEIGINGMRLFKLKGSSDVHLEFIWIEDGDLPEDYIQ